MDILFYVFTALYFCYAILTMAAAGIKLAKKEIRVSHVLMLTGAVDMVFFYFMELGEAYLAPLIIALSLIHLGAYLNGRKNGAINPSHHLIRLMVSAAIIVLAVIARQ